VREAAKARQEGRAFQKEGRRQKEERQVVHEMSHGKRHERERMFSMIRKRVTYANVVVTVALVFAMTGGAYAAKHYLISSTKQISPSVLKELAGKTGAVGKEGPAGKNGTNGSTGAPGPQGLQGLEGKAGKEGKQGEEGEEGREGKEGKEGKEGAKGQPWTPSNTLPSGATETGVWGTRPPEGKQELVSLSFPVALATELDEAHVHIAPNAACSGTVEKPTAEPGNLCVYPGVAANVKLEEIVKPYGFNEAGAGTTGANLAISGNTGVPVPIFYSNGSWAVTAK
jgi:hypothetical protein